MLYRYRCVIAALAAVFGLSASAPTSFAADPVNILGDAPILSESGHALMGGIPISQLPNLPGSTASLTDAFAAQSTSCTGGNCRITVAQILAAAAQTTGANAKIFSDSTGTAGMTSDAYQITGKLNGSDTINAQYILNCAVASQGCGSGIRFETDAIRGVSIIPAGSSGAFINAGVAGYVYNQTAFSNALGPAVAVNGIGVCAADNTVCWGINALVSDNTGFVPSSGIGRALYNELDINVTSPNTAGTILMLGGTWLAANHNINGMYIGAPGDPNNVNPQYANAIAIANGASGTGIALGTSTRSAPGGSQAIVFPYWQSAGVEHVSTLYTTSDGSLILDSNDAGNLDLLHGSLYMPSNAGVLINNNTVVAADSGATAFIGSGPSFQNVTIGNGNAAILMEGITILNTFNVSSSNGSCATGAITFDVGSIFVCIAPNHWRKVAVSDF